MKRLLAVLAMLVAAANATGAAGATAPRIVSLAPHVTELLYAAGAGPLVVGATEFSDFPPAARDLPRVGDAFRLDYERIVSLRPDFAVAWQSGTPAGALAQLEAVGVHVVVLPVQSLDDIAAAIEELGRLAGTADEAHAAASRFRNELADIRTRYAGRSRVSVFVELDHEPLFTVTGRHLISEMVSICGGSNVFESLPGLAPTVDLEAVIAAAPQAILYTGPDTDPGRHWRRWQEIPAVRDGNVMRAPADLISRATPRAAAGTRAVCEAIDGARRRLAAQAD